MQRLLVVVFWLSKKHSKVTIPRYTRFQRYFGVEGDLDVDVGVGLPKIYKRIIGYDLKVEDFQLGFGGFWLCPFFLQLKKYGSMAQWPLKNRSLKKKFNQVDLVIQHLGSFENDLYKE